MYGRIRHQFIHRGSRLHVWRWWQRPNVLLRRKWMQPRNSYDVALVIQFSYSTMELLDTSTPTYKITKTTVRDILSCQKRVGLGKKSYIFHYISGISMVRIISTRVRAMDLIATWNLYFFIIFAIFWWWFFEVWSTLQMLRNFQNRIK